MKYTVKQSSIACIIHVNGFGIIHFSQDKLPGKWEPGDKIWHALPKVVQDAIVARFTEVNAKVDELKSTPFNKDYKAFDAWLKTLPELTFEVPDNEVPAVARELSSTQLNPWYNPNPRPIVLPDPVEVLKLLKATGQLAVPA